MDSRVELEDKRSAIKKLIERDPAAADLRISLFVAAARSFKYDSCLQPFPPDYTVNKEKNIDDLNQVLAFLPPLRELNLSTLDERPVKLLYWILHKAHGPGLRTVPKSDFDHVFAKAPCLAAFRRPQLIFEVVYQDNASSERKFRENLDQFRSKYAYHGSKVFNFYSILNYGLQQHLNKTAGFGEGIYLSAELHVSQMFAPTGSGWAKSSLGSHLSCIALCEYIDNPAYVKCQEENPSSDMPEKYVLVKNNELVQVRYLLVYASNRNVAANANFQRDRQPKQQNLVQHAPAQIRPNRYVRWMAANKSWLLAGGYMFMLFAIGLMNSRNAHYMKQMFMQKLNYMCTALFGSIGDRDS